MVFASHVFIFYFLPIVLLLNYTLPFRYLTTMLMLCSYLFLRLGQPDLDRAHAYQHAGGLLLRFGPGEVFGAFHRRERSPLFLPAGQPRNRAQKTALAVSMSTNLAILGFFKYFDFGIANINTLCQTLGFGPTSWNAACDTADRHLFLHLPIDELCHRRVSRRSSCPKKSQLTSPVSWRSSRISWPAPSSAIGASPSRSGLAPSLGRSSPGAQRSSAWEWARRFCWLTRWATLQTMPSRPGLSSWYDAWYGLFAYAFQIYFDFSAYSDMAVGLALMLGFLFTKNFNDPYRANSITDFWRRWHISLSTWLRDYLYIPLGGNRRGRCASMSTS